MLFRLLSIVTILCILACSGLSEDDKQALVDTALEATEKADTLRERRDAALLDFEDAWVRVEGGPQIMLLARQDIADDMESRGLTIQARRMREDAQAEFEAEPLVIEATRLAAIYRGLDTSFVEANRKLADALVALQDAGITDLYRERILESE